MGIELVTLEREFRAVADTVAAAPSDAASPWRTSGPRSGALPRQGWKIHLSATILTATPLLSQVGPFLCRLGVPFKIPRSIGVLERLNAGLYGYSQIGKCITVYPQSEKTFEKLVDNLCELLPDMPCPGVPSDRRVRADRPIFYRYGVIAAEARGGELVDDSGNWSLDDRGGVGHHARWVADPLQQTHSRAPAAPTYDNTASTLLAYGVLGRRGKGGVYEALDFSCSPARRCVLKEGLRHGEVDLSGRDGRDRIEREQRTLRELAGTQTQVPVLLSSYDVGPNAYSVLARIDGLPLSSLTSNAGLGSDRSVSVARRIAKELHHLHGAGWIWRDCKPSNIVVGSTGVWLIDFEGACRSADPDADPYGSPGHMAPSPKGHRVSAADDVYSLGATFFQMFGGRIVPAAGGVRREGRMHLVSRRVSSLTASMLSADPSSRPSLGTVIAQLDND